MTMQTLPRRLGVAAVTAVIVTATRTILASALWE